MDDDPGGTAEGSYQAYQSGKTGRERAFASQLSPPSGRCVAELF